MRASGPTMKLRLLAWIGLAILCAGFLTGRAIGQDRHADPSLEALLPEVLAGISLTRESQSGADLTRPSDAFDEFLKSLGKQRADFTVASAYANGVAAEIGAWRVKGLTAAQLMPGFKVALQASSKSALVIMQTELSGRPATQIGDDNQLARGPLYVTEHADALLFVQSRNAKLAAEAFERLPR